MKNNSVFHDEFIPFIHRAGKRINTLGIVLCFGPCIALALMGILPPWEALIAGLSVQIPAVMSAYIYEPISYFPVLGVPGTYMSFLSGNISNLRVPCSEVAQNAVGVKQGSPEGTIISTIGIAISTFVNIVILTLGIIFGTYIISKLPPKMVQALNLLLPALFAALMGNYISKQPKLAIVAVPLGLIMVLLNKGGHLSFLPGVLASALPILVSVFGTMGVGIVLARNDKLD